MNDSTRRSLLIGLPALLFVVGAVLGWIGHTLMSPAGKVPTVSVYNNWRLGCPALSDGKGSCTMQLPVLDAQSGGSVANLLFGHSPGGLKMEVTLPLEVLIVPGMGLVLDSDKIRTYPYETCVATGCVSTIPVDDKLMASLEKATKAQLVFAIPNAKKPYAVSFPLAGFKEAHDAFLRDDAARHSWWWRLFS
jgi:invasion protein IalB